MQVITQYLCGNKKYKPQLLSKTKLSNSDDVIRQHTNHIVKGKV